MNIKFLIVQTVTLSQQSIIPHLNKTFVVNYTALASVKKILQIKNYVTKKSDSHIAAFFVKVKDVAKITLEVTKSVILKDDLYRILKKN